MTNEQHNRYVAYSFLGYLGFQLFWTLLMMAMMYFMFTSMPGRPGDPGPPMEFFGIMFVFMAIIQIIFTGPAAIAAWAVLKKKKWARIASIIAAAMSVMSVPVGTAAGVYALWFFLGDQWKEVYETPIESKPYATLGLNQADSWSPANEERFRQPEYEPKPGNWR